MSRLTYICNMCDFIFDLIFLIPPTRVNEKNIIMLFIKTLSQEPL